jgi:glyoxylase-like metal-dependent hydrolase (beta-lactamase superfamily II)
LSLAQKIVRLNDRLYRLGPLGDPPVLSSYLILDEKVAIVDCGPQSVIEELLSLIEDCGISAPEIDCLLLTHIHLDHAGGAGLFLDDCKSATAFVPERGIKHLLDPTILNSSSLSVLGERIFRNWGACGPVPTDKAVAVKSNSKINLGNIELEYLPATGHAPHQNVIYNNKESIMFSADALGIYDRVSDSIIPTTPPPSFELEQAIRDVQMIRDLKPELACLAHFGELRPDDEYFDLVSNTFRQWGNVVSRYVRENDLSSYSFDNCVDLFSALSENWPKYRNLSEDLKEQVTRVDIGGLLHYFTKVKSQAR